MSKRRSFEITLLIKSKEASKTNNKDIKITKVVDEGENTLLI
jgi:hypothetical protein